MTIPPRVTEVLLQSLGAHAAFREPLLGDMAEEFTMRARRDGPASARRWYHREAMRAVPHLLYDFGRDLRMPELRRQGSILLLAWFLTSVITAVLSGMALGVAAAMGVSSPALLIRAGDPAALAMLVSLGVLGTVVGGYIAASFNPVAPLVSALLLGVAWSTIGLTGGVVTHLAGGYAGPLWYRAAMYVVTLTGPVLGGMLHVRRGLSSRDESPSSAPIAS
jgi:hypothetical protein